MGTVPIELAQMTIEFSNQTELSFTMDHNQYQQQHFLQADHQSVSLQSFQHPINALVPANGHSRARAPQPPGPF